MNPADANSGESDSPAVAPLDSAGASVAASPSHAMLPGGEYDRLQQRLLLTTVLSGTVVAISMAFFYPLGVVANYGIGVLGGLVYLRMLARAVARLGRQQQLGYSRLALFAGLIILATQVDALQVLPIFFGFITYKAALLVYAVQTLSRSANSKSL